MSFWSAITGTEDQASQDARLAQQEQAYRDALARREAAGTITPDQVAADTAYLDSVALDSTDQAAWEGFQQGAKEGLGNVLDFPGKLVGGVGSGASRALWGVLKNIPWWVYVGAIAFAFFYFGGGPILRRSIARHLK